MKVEIIKAYGDFKVGDTITRMHPSTAKALVVGKLVKIVKKETKNGTGIDDFYGKGKNKMVEVVEEEV